MSLPFDPELDEVVRASDRPTYNTAAVEQRTGLRPATFRAWERRYGFPKPRRLPGNQRLYSDQDMAAIRWLQHRTDEGLSISHAIRLLQERLREGAGYPHHHATVDDAGRSPESLAEDLTGALLAFDSNAAEAVLNEAFAMYRVEDICMKVLAPALVDIGERWHRSEISVATEHFATSFMRRKLFALFNAYETGRGRGLVFAGCAPEEWHEVGILMISLFMVRHGIRVNYLGPNLGANGLAETLRHHRPDLLVVSATSDESAERVVDIAEVISALPEPRPILAYGGQGFWDESRRRRIGGVYLGSDAREAITVIDQILNAGNSGNGTED